MSVSGPSLTTIASVSGRTADVPNLQALKSPEEGGNKKEYEEFIEKVGSFVTITWTGGQDVGYILKNGETPQIDPPADLSSDEAKSALKKRQWDRKADVYADRLINLENNKTALFALLYQNVTKIMRAKLKSKKGYHDAEASSNVEWMINTFDDIMSNFEEITPNILSLDDQMERIMKIRQGNLSNKDFIKVIQKEIKIYEKHGGSFLWGKKQDERLAAQITDIVNDKAEDGEAYTAEEVAAQKKIAKKKLQDEVVAMSIIKRADKRRFGNLQIELKNAFLLGQNEYPTSISEALKVLNNYKPIWTSGASSNRHTDNNNQRTNNTPHQNGVSFLQSQGTSTTIEYLRGSNGSFFSNVECRLCGLKGHYLLMRLGCGN